MSAGERAAEALLQRKDELARNIVADVYADDPALLERYGERGRAKCLQDTRYNLEHLAPALALDEPAMFTGYVRWLADLLAAYGIPAAEIRRSLELTRARLAAELPHEEAQAAAAIIDAGMDALS